MLSPLRPRPSATPALHPPSPGGLDAGPSLQSLPSTVAWAPTEPRPGDDMLASAGTLPARAQARVLPGGTRLPPPFRRNRAPPVQGTAPGSAEDPAYRPPRGIASASLAVSTGPPPGSTLDMLMVARSGASRAMQAASAVLGRSDAGPADHDAMRSRGTAAQDRAGHGTGAASAARIQQQLAARAGLLDPSFARSAGRRAGQSRRNTSDTKAELAVRRRQEAAASLAASIREAGAAGTDLRAVAASKRRLLGKAGDPPKRATLAERQSGPSRR